MSTFDAAVALSQDQLNTVAAAIYSKIFPQVFTGSKTAGQLGVDSVQWSINLPPSFNLAPSAQQSAAAAVANSLWEQHGAQVQGTGITQDNVHQMVGDNTPTFEVDFPDVGITLIPTGGGPVGYYPLSNVKASCYIQISGNLVSLVSQTVTCDPLPNPTDEFFVKLIILPALQSALGSLLSGLKIPPFTFEGVQLSNPSAAIVDNYIVAAVNLAAKGTPAPAPAGSWTPQPFSLLMSQDLLQAGASGQGKSFSDSGSGGNHVTGGYDWSYSLSLVHPSVSITGTDLAIDFSLAGSASANAYVIGLSVGIGYDAQAIPSPTAVCRLVPQNGQVEVITQSVSPFTVIVTPSGSISDKILGWILEAIVQGIVGSVSPLISQFLGGITFTSISIPTFSEGIAGTAVTMAPTNLAVYNVNGCLAMGGVLAIS